MAEVGSAFVSILPSARGFGSKLNSEVGGELDSAGKSSGKRFGAALKVGALGVVAGGAVLGGFLKGAIDQASDLNEQGTKIEAIFGRGSAAVQKFAAGGAEKLGQTKLAVLEASATFGTFGKAAGLSGNELADFSTGFTGLATDLASFNNTTPEEAVEAIGAALRGEAEPMRRFGVLLDDATLRQEALRLGLVKTTKEALTPQQKVLAAQAAIYKQTADAQGDFERTSGGLANQQRILSAQFSDLKTSIGVAFLPIAVRAVTALNGMFDKARQLAPAVKAVGDFFAPVVTAVRGFFSSLSTGGGAVSGFATALGPIRGALSNLVGAFRGMIATVAPIVARLVGVIRSNWDPIVGYVRTNFGAVRSIIASILNIIATGMRTSTNVIRAVWDRFGGDVLKIATTVFRTVANVVQGALKVIQGIFRTVSAALRGDWAGAWQGIRTIASGATQAITAIVRGAFNLLKTIAQAAMREFLSAVRQGFQNAVAAARALPGLIRAALGAVGSMLYSVGRDMILGLINGIKAMASSVASAAKSVVSNAISAAKSALKIRSPSRVFDEIGRYTMDGFRKGIEKGGKKAVETLKGVLDKAKEKGQELKSVAASFSDSVVSSLQTGDLFGAGAAGLRDTLTARLTGAQGMLAALNAASKKGLDGGLFAEVAKSGDVATAQEIAAMSAAEIAALENLYNQTSASISAVAEKATDRQYGEQLRQQNELIRDLKAALKKLPKEVGDAAEDGTRKGSGDRDKQTNQRARAGR